MFKNALAAAALIALVAAGAASASTHNFNFPLDGLQETPPNASPATGNCMVSLDDVTGDVNVNCNFSGLLAPATAAHIHGPAPAGTPAGVILPLTVTFGTSGTVTGMGTLSPANVTNMINELTYVNIHSSVFPGGEIRGQIVPEPATAMLLGLGGLLVVRRRRR